VLITVTVAPRVRSATAKNNAMAIAPGLIWRAIFVFIRHSVYPFLRKILAGVAKKLRDTEGLPFAKAKA